jgi:two-component system sensor histidine kinase PilS (NtrC family)
MRLKHTLDINYRLGSSDSSFKQQLMWMLLLRVILYTLLLGVSFLLQDDKFEVITLPPNLLILFVLIVYISSIGSAFYLIRSKRNFRIFGFIQSLLDTVFCTVMIYLSGGSQSAFISIYFFPIISGGLLIPIKGGLIAAAASTLLFGAILGLEHGHYMPEYLLFLNSVGSQSIQTSINHFAIRGLSFFLAAVVSALIGARLKTTAEALTSTKHDFDRLSQLYKQIFDNITTGIITVDINGTITSANNATVAITGLQMQEMIGRQFFHLFPLIDLTNPSPRNACDFERSDKQKIRLGYAHAALEHPLQSNESASPDDEITTIITLKDISEIERLEAQMRQAEKLAAIGMMSAGIAHDFRNPLTAISGSAQILAQEYSSGDSSQLQNYQLTKIILRESDRLINTIADFLKFARPDTIDREWFQLRPCIQEILEVCRADPSWPASCRVTFKMDSRFSIWADEQQLFTVINHLIQNGLAFCKPGDEQIEITAENKIGPGDYEMSHITVRDNGPGIDPSHINQIFEPFFTSRTDGTGLGLAIVKQTIDAHNGYIFAENTEPGGAIFSVYLPVPPDH